MFTEEFKTGQACGNAATEQSPWFQFVASTRGKIFVFNP